MPVSLKIFLIIALTFWLMAAYSCVRNEAGAVVHCTHDGPVLVCRDD